MIRPIRSIALAVGLGTMLVTLYLPASADDKGTWRCTGADGKVLFTNGDCPAGTTKASPWVPTPAETRIERTGPGDPAPLAARERPLDPLLPTGRVDPFVDCKARGGDFDVAARVCRLPPGGTAPWVRVED